MASILGFGPTKNLWIVVVIAIAGIGSLLYYRASAARPKKIPIEVLFANPKKVGALISPDGLRIAYLAPVKERLNIWVKTVGKEDDRPVTTQQERDIHQFSWAFDNKHILFMQDDKGDENFHVYKLDVKTLEQVDLTPFKGARSAVLAGSPLHPTEILVVTNKDNLELFNVYHLDLQTGECTLVEKNPGSVIAWYADLDLHVRAAFTSNTDGSRTLLYRSDAAAVWRELASWDWQDVDGVDFAGFSRDGKSIYLTDPKDVNTSQLVQLNTENMQRTVLVSDSEYDIAGVAGDAYDTLCFVSVMKDRLEWRGLTPEYEKIVRAMQKVDSGDMAISSCTAFKDQGPAQQKWILSFTHDDRSTTFYLFDATTTHATFLFAARPELDEYKLASMKPILFTSRDGLTIHGYLTVPAGSVAKKLPMVLYVHGGPWLRDSWGFDPFAQFFANRGYACLRVNFRGSTGYGKKFVNASNKEWGGKMHDDLVDAVKWAVDQGIADPKKVAIFGGSYGGYAALVGATFTPDLFCCAVDYVGPSNLVTMLSTIPPYWKPEKEKFALRVGRLETEEEFLKSRSPLFKVNAIKIPMLIIQGANDPRVKKAEADQIVEAMKAKHLDVEYILFADEGHGATGQKNNIAVATAMEKFFAKHLG